MQPNGRSQGQEENRLDKVKLSDQTVAKMIIMILQEKRIINDQTAKAVMEKLNGMQTGSEAA